MSSLFQIALAHLDFPDRQDAVNGYLRRRKIPHIGERARHGQWNLQITPPSKPVMLIAQGRYYYGRPDGDWLWYAGEVDQEIFCARHKIAAATFVRGTPDGEMVLYHADGSIALQAHFDYGQKKKAWIAFDAAGREIWQGNYEGSVIKTNATAAVTSEEGVQGISWVRDTELELPRFGAYARVCNILSTPSLRPCRSVPLDRWCGRRSTTPKRVEPVGSPSQTQTPP